eukprot:2179581-Amphidinium_carterae.1
MPKRGQGTKLPETSEKFLLMLRKSLTLRLMSLSSSPSYHEVEVEKRWSRVGVPAEVEDVVDLEVDVDDVIEWKSKLPETSEKFLLTLRKSLTLRLMSMM